MSQPTAYLPPFSVVAAAHQRGERSANDVVRAIMAHDGWRAAGMPDEHGRAKLAVLRAPNGGRILELFSDGAAYAAFAARERADDPEHVVEIAGHALFAQLPDGSIDRVNFDLHSPHGLKYEGSHLPLLRAWAGVVQVELALYEPDRVADALGALRGFGDFYILLRGDGDERELVLAPDSDDRPLLAAFTADDCAERFLEVVGAELPGEVELVRQSGPELFGLLRSADLDGVVFNALSQLPARAISASIVDVILPN